MTTGRPAVITVLQGQYRVSDRPDAVMSTILGSCVAACIYDPDAGVGGMNHFLLPGIDTGQGSSVRYGVHAMELLINALLGAGARRGRLQAKLFGGARMTTGMCDVGAANVEFALWFLGNERIPVIGRSLGGERGRKLRFRPHDGQAQQMFMAGVARTPPPVAPDAADGGGDVTLF